LRINQAIYITSLSLLFFLGASSSASENELFKLEAMQVARDLMGSESYYDQYQGAGILVEIGDKNALQLLADGLADNDWVLMRSAIDQLLTVEHPNGLDLLYRYADISDDPIFFKFLSESLASRPRDDLADFLVELLDSEDTWVKKHAMQALATSQFDSKEITMKKIAGDTNQDPLTRAYAFYALLDTSHDQYAKDMLLGITDNWGVDALEVQAVAIGKFQSELTEKRLSELRGANTYKVQIAAMASEAGFGNEAATLDLLAIIAHGKGLDPSVAAASLSRLPTAIGNITDELIRCCDLGSDTGTRLVEAWENITSDHSAIVDWALNNKNADIRMQGVWLVGAKKDSRYLKDIIPMLKSTDECVKGMAAWSVIKIIGKSS
jgi:HEAT repeat protein